MPGDVFLVFRTLTLVVADMNVTFLHAEKNYLQKEFPKTLCTISVFSDNTYMLHFQNKEIL